LGDETPLGAGIGGAGLDTTAATLTHDGSTEPALAAWTAVLDVLEMAVHAAERTLKDPLGPLSSAPHTGVVLSAEERWSPPTVTSPLPLEVRRRAVALSAAQERVARRLEEARLGVARQLQAVSSVPGVGESSAAVYLDVNG